PTTILSSRNGKSSADSRQRRLSQYHKVINLRDQGQSVRAIARSLKMSRMTVYRYLGSEGFPDRAPAKERGSKLTAYLSYLHRRWAAGCHNATQLWREIAGQGYGGQAAMVRRYVRGLRKRLSAPAPTTDGSAGIRNSFADPSTRQVAWWL